MGERQGRMEGGEGRVESVMVRRGKRRGGGGGTEISPGGV